MEAAPPPPSPERLAFREKLLKELPHLGSRSSPSWTAGVVWALALAIYTYAVCLTVRSATPPCKCNWETRQTVNAAARIEYRDEIACDPVRWALWMDNNTFDGSDSFRSSGAGRAVQVGQVNKGNVHADENPHAEKAAERYKFYAGIRGKSKYPPDRIAFTKFFAGAGSMGSEIGVNASRAQDLRDGVFVEVGVGDAIRNSISLFFERHLNWTGIIMEGAAPNLGNFNTSKRAKGTIKVAKAACKEGGVAKMRGSGFTAGLADFMPKAHVERNMKIWQEKWRNPYDAICIPLSEVLRANRLQHIDLLSIDVEGAESEVLRGLDFANVNIRVIILDLPVPQSKKEDGKMEEEARSILDGHGFCLCSRIGPLEYWTSDPELRKQHCGWDSFRKNP